MWWLTGPCGSYYNWRMPSAKNIRKLWKKKRKKFIAHSLGKLLAYLAPHRKARGRGGKGRVLSRTPALTGVNCGGLEIQGSCFVGELKTQGWEFKALEEKKSSDFNGQLIKVTNIAKTTWGWLVAWLFTSPLSLRQPALKWTPLCNECIHSQSWNQALAF